MLVQRVDVLSCVPFILLLLTWCSAVTASDDAAREYATCASYFFMAAKVRPLGEFDALYRSGEYSLNNAIKSLGKQDAMTAFNTSASEINQLIENSLTNFAAADERYEVRCADIFREATRLD